jgi:hypothetical protein
MGKTIFADTSKDGAAECSDANYPFDFHFTQLVVTGQLYAAAPVAGLLKPALAKRVEGLLSIVWTCVTDENRSY